jgi:hypothetical protein
MLTSPTPTNDLVCATSAHKVGNASWIPRGPRWGSVLRLSAALVLAATAGCAAETQAATSDERAQVVVAEGTSAPTIFGGEKDDDATGASAVVALRVGTGSTFELCSGALVAPNVVLTARHCVTRNATSAVACDEKGHSANGTHVTADEDPSTIGVYVGSSPSFGKAPVARARAIVAPGGAYLCDSDIALVVLETSITNVTPLAVRLHGPARKGELIRSIGYGQNDRSEPIGTRFRKERVAVLAQGAAVSASKTPLGAHEFEVGVSICQGDSGGPAISEETGAVIGVVSRGGSCSEDFGHIYTTTAGFDDLFAQAFGEAGATPRGEEGDIANIGASTRSKSTAAPSASDGDPSSSMGGCSIAAGTSTGNQRGTYLCVLAAAVVALASRRRRAR